MQITVSRKNKIVWSSSFGYADATNNIYHAGDSFSGSSYLIIYPDDDIVIAFLANSQEGIYFNVQQIGELFYKN